MFTGFPTFAAQTLFLYRHFINKFQYVNKDIAVHILNICIPYV